jgi:alpha-N-arabinofuranosidase
VNVSSGAQHIDSYYSVSTNPPRFHRGHRVTICPMNRRDFVLSGLALVAPRLSSATSARIDILPQEVIGTISPNIYGHFTEHLGGCIYGGIWVGEKSKVPNIGGIRRDLIDKLRLLNPPVIRWPGGCFADSYSWRDGVGPRDRRPTRTNFWANTPYLEKAPDGPAKYEPNQFGTNEFARFCKLAGAQPYFAANLRSLTAFDFYEWVEYCNSPAGTTTLADLRAQGGDREPFNVRFWGVGNESWGCGGSFTGDEYAVEFRRFAEWLPRFGVQLALIASGPNVADYAWTRSFFDKLTEKSKGPLRNVFGCALHYYCGGASKGNSLQFDDDDWYKLLSDAVFMEELISNHWQIMGEVDTRHSVKLVVDEWGAWHETDPNIDPSYLFAYYPTLRDALVSGLTLDIFNRNADKVAMANAAQLVNNIHTSFIAVGDRLTVTPIYQVFRMYAPHQGGASVRTLFDTSHVSSPSAKRLGALSGSCSIQGNKGVLTVVNPDIHNPQEAEINIRGSRIAKARATVLTSSDIHAHNTLDEPNAIQPAEKAIASASPFVFEFPPASVTCLQFDLG